MVRSRFNNWAFENKLTSSPPVTASDLYDDDFAGHFDLDQTRQAYQDLYDLVSDSVSRFSAPVKAKLLLYIAHRALREHDDIVSMGTGRAEDDIVPMGTGRAND